MNRIKALSRYQKTVLLFILAMVAVFTVLYPLTCSRVGLLYHDAILLPDQQNGGTVYAGEIQGEDARFTVSADKTVTGPQVYKEGEKYCLVLPANKQYIITLDNRLIEQGGTAA